MNKGLMTTVQESKGKYTVSVPSALVSLLEIDKGDKFKWTMNGDGLVIEVVKS